MFVKIFYQTAQTVVIVLFLASLIDWYFIFVYLFDSLIINVSFARHCYFPMYTEPKKKLSQSRS